MLSCVSANSHVAGADSVGSTYLGGTVSDRVSVIVLLLSTLSLWAQ